MQLEQIVAGCLVRAHELHRGVGVRRGVAVERGRRDEHRRTEDLAFLQLLAEHELVRGAEHRADGRDAVRDVEEHEVAIELLRLLRPEHVCVHLGESGHEELALGIDALRISRNSDGSAWPHGGDAAVADEDGLAGESSLTIHWQHGHVDERVCAGCDRSRSVAREKRRDERGEEQHGSIRHSPQDDHEVFSSAIPTGTTLRHNAAYQYAAPVR